MQFIVIAYDGTDEDAMARRMAAREAHLQFGKELYASGQWLFGGALLDDAGRMIGSMIVCEFPSRDEMDKQWLSREPYILGDVWRKIDIRRAQVPSFCAAK